MTRLEDWQRRTEVPLIWLGGAFFVLYAWHVLDQHAGPAAHWTVVVVWLVLWLVFVLEFAYRMYLSGEPLRYARRNPLDVVFIVIPVLQPLRVLRVVKNIRRLSSRVQGGRAYTALVYVGLYTIIAVVFLSLVELQVERNAPGATITTFGNALWWACTTVTTVGYGDTYPVTTAGRFVAVILMLSGVALVGSVTGAGAALLADRSRHSDE